MPKVMLEIDCPEEVVANVAQTLHLYMVMQIRPAYPELGIDKVWVEDR